MLIHEATFGHSCAEHAKLKTHSTTDQAIEVAKAAGAKFTLLTHFSPRYPRLVEYSDNLLDDTTVGITFDNMVVSTQVFNARFFF